MSALVFKILLPFIRLPEMWLLKTLFLGLCIQAFPQLSKSNIFFFFPFHILCFLSSCHPSHPTCRLGRITLSKWFSWTYQISFSIFEISIMKILCPVLFIDGCISLKWFLNYVLLEMLFFVWHGIRNWIYGHLFFMDALTMKFCPPNHKQIFWKY